MFKIWITLFHNLLLPFKAGSIQERNMLIYPLDRMFCIVKITWTAQCKNRCRHLCCRTKRRLGWHHPSKVFYLYHIDCCHAMRRLARHQPTQAFFCYDNFIQFSSKITFYSQCPTKRRSRRSGASQDFFWYDNDKDL